MLFTATVFLLIASAIGIAAWVSFSKTEIPIVPHRGLKSLDIKDLSKYGNHNKLKVVDIEASQELHPYETKENNIVVTPAAMLAIPLSLGMQLNNIEVSENEVQKNVYHTLVKQIGDASNTLVQIESQIRLITLLNNIEDEFTKLSMLIKH